MDRPITFKGLLAMTLLGWLLALPSVSSANGDFDIEQNDDLFDISADSASLAKIIDELSELTEIPMNIAEEQDTQVTLSLEEYTLDALISELTTSSLVVHKNVDGTDVISEVTFIIGDGGNNVAGAALPSGEPNAGIIAGDELPEQVSVEGTGDVNQVEPAMMEEEEDDEEYEEEYEEEEEEIMDEPIPDPEVESENPNEN